MFKQYEFIEHKKAQADEFFFIREILEDGTLVTDLYVGEDLIARHHAILDPENYKAKKVRATFKITEYYPNRRLFIERDDVFMSVSEIQSPAPGWIISDVIIICDIDCKAFGIDPAAPWPPV